MIEFRRKITFFWGGYIYYLTVSSDEYCALSALWRRCRGAYCCGGSLHLLHVVIRNKWGPFSADQRKASSPPHCVVFPDKILMLCPLCHPLILSRGFIFHITPADGGHRFTHLVDVKELELPSRTLCNGTCNNVNFFLTLLPDCCVFSLVILTSFPPSPVS